MQRRQSMRRGKSRKLFRKTADLTHKFNIKARPMRGGIRL